MKDEKINIDSLLKKSSLRGEEVARIMFQDWGVLYNELVERKIDPKGFLKDEELKTLVNKIDGSLEYQKYLDLMKIPKWVNENFKSLSAYEQQGYYCSEKINSKIKQLILIEEFRKLVNDYPIIMTTQEYEERIEELKKEKMDFISVFREVLFERIFSLKANPRKKNILRPLKKEYTNLKIDDNIILEIFGAKKMNAWDFISDFEKLSNFYQCFSYRAKDKERVKSFDEFKKKFKATYDIILQELGDKFPNIQKIKKSNWLEKIISFNDLIEKGILIDFNAYIFMYKENFFCDNDKDEKRTIAILDGIKAPTFNQYPLIDSDIIYKELDSKENIESFKDTFEGLKYSLYFQQGYNTALDIVKKIYYIPELESFKSDISDFYSELELYNKSLIKLKDMILTSESYTELEKNKKIEVLEKLFKKVDTAKLKTPEENIKKAEAIAKEGTDFTNTSDFINLLADLDIANI